MPESVLSIRGWKGAVDSVFVRAARPTLFSAARWPELIVCLLLANLMSPRLWELADKLIQRRGAHALLKSIHRFVNTHFYHGCQRDYGRIWGFEERDRISDPRDLAANDYAMSVIAEGLQRLKNTNPCFAPFIDLARAGIFPLYAYPTVDAILAHGPALRTMPARPIGMTSCLDECVLIASLAVAAGACGIEDLAFLGSPLHYTLLVSAESEVFWFNAKREFFDAESWRSTFGGGSPARIQEAFDEKVVLCDRVITAQGSCVFPTGPATLTAERAGLLAESAERFFGAEIAQLREASRLAAARMAPPASAGFAGLDRCRSSSEFEKGVLDLAERHPGSVHELALYTFRHPKVAHPEAYIAAAMEGFRVFLRSAEVDSIEDAVQISRGITGHDSVFGSTNRLALPDEVILFDRAGESERALLAYSLAMLSSSIPPEQKRELDLSRGADGWKLVGHRDGIGAPPAPSTEWP